AVPVRCVRHHADSGTGVNSILLAVDRHDLLDAVTVLVLGQPVLGGAVEVGDVADGGRTHITVGGGETKHIEQGVGVGRHGAGGWFPVGVGEDVQNQLAL